MSVDELCFLSIAEALRLLRRKRLTARELLDAHLKRIAALDPALRTYLAVCEDRARREAARPTGPLAGVPISYKDLIDTAGVATTGGSRLYAKRVPTRDAWAVERLVRAGAVTLGKASMNEFAFSPSLEDDFAKPVRNPWSAAAPAGLSSGGSAAGVAAGLAMASIGSDSGGSIRIPSSYCGVTGLKPTYGRIGRTGVMPLSHSLDHLGVMARSAEDVALVFAAAAGHDPSDSASVDRPVPGPSQLTGRPVRGMRIGTCPRFVEAAGAQREVREALQEAAARFQSMGATLREVAIPHLAWGAAATFTLLRIEGWHAHLPALKKHWREYGRGALKQIAAGAFLSAADYLRAQQARTLIAREVAGAFAEVDLLLLPSTPQSAASGEWDRTPADSKVARSGVAYLSPFNLTGSPALALPGGFNAAGMPVGLQLIGRPFEEDAVLSAAFRFQQETRHHLRRPPLAAG